MAPTDESANKQQLSGGREGSPKEDGSGEKARSGPSGGGSPPKAGGGQSGGGGGTS